MREVLPDIERWKAEGKRVAAATVVQTWGSAPRAAGSKMVMTAEGGIAGSVSGGCVESAVFEAGRQALASGKPRLLHFGVTDDRAWEVGLACGGTIEVFVETLDEATFSAYREAAGSPLPSAVVTVVRGPEALLGRRLYAAADGRVTGSLAPDLDEAARRAAAEALATRRSRRAPLKGEPSEQEVEAFIEILAPPPELIAVGGVHIALALTAMARTLGFRTTVVDPRQAFGNRERFPAVDRLLTSWPDAALREIGLTASSAVAVLTHDPKLDDPALSVALASPAFYVGALGSRRTQEKRRRRLLDAGLSEESLARLYAPIGLPLGGRTPEEIAVAILAQIVQARNAGPAGEQLTE